MEHHTSHPSDSIPNAAYPDDSSYRPGGNLQLDTATTGGRPGVSQHSPSFVGTSPSSAHSQHPYQQQPPYQPHPHEHALPPPNTPLLSASSASSQNPSSWTSVSHPRPAPPAGAVLPDEPPPPYYPSQTPSAYSPLDTPGAPSAHPVSSVPYPPSQLSHSVSQTQPPLSPNPYHVGSAAGSSYEAGPPKLGPVAAARRRRRRVCLIAAALVMIFVIALVVGVALGVLKQRFKDDDDDH